MTDLHRTFDLMDTSVRIPDGKATYGEQADTGTELMLSYPNDVGEISDTPASVILIDLPDGAGVEGYIAEEQLETLYEGLRDHFEESEGVPANAANEDNDDERADAPEGLEDVIYAGFQEVDADDGAANPRVTNYDPAMSAILWTIFESEGGEPYRDDLLDAIEDKLDDRPTTQSAVAKQLQRIGLNVVAPEYFEAAQRAKLRSEGGL